MIGICDGIEINGQTYVLRGKTTHALDDASRPFVIIRSYGAGVFAGYLAARNDTTRVVKLDGCIRLHAWTGCSLSQVARDGIAGTGTNRFSIPRDGHEIFEVLEIIPCSEHACAAIQGVPTWEK